MVRSARRSLISRTDRVSRSVPLRRHVPDLHPAFIAGTRQVLAARLSRRRGLRRRPPAHIEVIVMTTSQRPRRADSPVRRVLRRSARALKNLHKEQAYAWECYLRPTDAPRSRT